MQDLRYIRTEKSIRDAFFKLLSQKNLSQITVTELSKEAFLGRGTFYLHYTDIYELFSAITKEHISNIFKKIDASDRTQAAVFAIRNNIVNLYEN